MQILMPQLGETVAEGTVAAWHKQVGDTVAKDEILLDVETDKVATEIPAPAAGVLRAILVEEGETVDVGVVLALLEADEEAASAEAPQPAVAGAPQPGDAPAAAPRPAAVSPDSHRRLSPAVRRLVAEHDLDIDAIEGTGQGGRITRRDVLAHIERSDRGASGDQRIPFDRVRRVTAEHMVRSKATSPHVLQAIEADFSAVDAVRLARKDQWKSDHGFSLSYLPFVARAVLVAIPDFPRVNARVDDDALLVLGDINLAIAIDLNFEGLVAPVIKETAALTVPELALRINDLSTRARNQRLTADELQGGTYTLSNPGPFGTLFTAPIINQPQVAILSMDAISKRPVVVSGDDGDSIEIRPVGVLAHSFDHRAIDGAYSAAYLRKVKETLEQRDWSAEF